MVILFVPGDLLVRFNFIINCIQSFLGIKKAYHFIDEKCQINFFAECNALKTDIEKCENDFKKVETEMDGIMYLILNLRACELNPDCKTCFESIKIYDVSDFYSFK